MLKKLKEYKDMGIPSVILIEPATNQISQYSNGNLTVVTNTIQQLSGSRCYIDWHKVEELLD